MKNSFRQLRHAGDALLRAPPAFVRSVACVRFEMLTRALTRTREERHILFRGTRYNARHARHNGANLFNLTNNKLISWLIRRDGFARHYSGRFPYAHSVLCRYERQWIFPTDQWLTILFCTNSWKYPFDGTRSCLDRTDDVINLGSERYHSDNEREFVSLSCDTFEVWVSLFQTPERVVEFIMRHFPHFFLH